VAASSSVFGPVWTVLYALMAVSAWMVWREREEDPDNSAIKPALQLFGVQLAVNALWSWVFFRWHLGALSVLTIIVLIALVSTVAVRFYRIRQAAGVLLVPYIAWLAYAGCLALVAWRRNPGVL